MDSKQKVPWGTRESTPVERILDLHASASSLKQESLGFSHGECQKVSVMFEQRHEARQIPRTVREAKARRKGNRGNPRRRKVRTTTRTVMYDTLVTEKGALSGKESMSGTTITFEATSTNTESMGALGGVPAAQRAINER